jgi:alkylglycerol monooxygenase
MDSGIIQRIKCYGNNFFYLRYLNNKMKIDFINIAIPFFFLLIGIEVAFNFIRKKGFYRLNDSINDLSLGISEQLIEVFLKVLFFGAYLYLYANYHIFEISVNSLIGWALCFVAVDFCYYWFHRMSHEVSIIWGSHVPHHTSEEYNLTVALRQGTFERCFSTLFFLPLAIVGFHPVLYLANTQLNTIYQFWVHTRAIDKLGFLEKIFNTPSHHRVHHGKNPIYIDRNYGGVFIFWDKLFGSFQEEQEEVVFGTVSPLNSWNPVWANLHFWQYLIIKSYRTPKFSDKVKIWFKGPGWDPANPDAPDIIPEVQANNYKKYNPVIPLGLSIYTLVQFIPTTIIATIFLKNADNLLLIEKIGFVALTLFTLVSLGAIFDLKKWVLPAEIVRLFILISVFMANNGLILPVKVVLTGITIILLFWFLRYRSLFMKSTETNKVIEAV